MSFYQNGILISGVNTLPELTRAQYEALPADKRPEYWVCLDEEYEPSSSGHEIENSAGTKLTQRDVMQVSDGLEAVDDSTNQKTKIKMNLPIVSNADWNAMTEQEKTAYKASHYRFGVEVPDTEGVINAEYMKLLWENPNTTQDFVEQTITLNSADYDFLLCIYGFSNLFQKSGTIIAKGQGAILDVATVSSNGSRNYARNLTYVSDTSLLVSQGVIATGTTATSTANNACIPIAIYGIKASFQFKVNAIATDLSTRADHCFLSDDETSVEDAIDGIITQKSVINDVLTSGNTTGSFSWTAPQDAVVRANGQSAQIEVNGVTVFSSNGFTGYYSFPVKSGDNVIVKGSASYTCYYDMFKR